MVENFPAGEYAIAVWDKEALSLEEKIDQNKTMQVYPNPSNGRVNVKWHGICNGHISLVAPDGKEVRRVGFTQAESVAIATSDLPQGCYTVTRFGTDGKAVETDKLIIK